VDSFINKSIEEKVLKDPEILKLIEKGKVTIIDFYATWCPPCKLLAEVLDKISSSEIVIKKIDVDKHQELAERIGINAVPFVLIFNKEGKIFTSFTGYKELEELKALLARARKAL
jgi:thioredoxin 1